jgi:hypothetical protein
VLHTNPEGRMNSFALMFCRFVRCWQWEPILFCAHKTPCPLICHCHYRIQIGGPQFSNVLKFCSYRSG